MLSEFLHCSLVFEHSTLIQSKVGLFVQHISTFFSALHKSKKCIRTTFKNTITMNVELNED